MIHKHVSPFALLAVSTAALGLAGCAAVGPNYTPTTTDTAAAWSTSVHAEAAIATDRDAETRWWAAFRDPLLEALVEHVAAHNHDVAIAAARLIEARALRGVAAAAWYPQVDADASAVRQSLSENGANPVARIPGADLRRNIYTAGFDAAWEIDFFGGTRRAVEAAEARIGGAVEDGRAVLLAVLAEVARNYAEARGAQRRIAIAEKSVELQRQTVDLVGKQLRAGAASRFDLDRAEAELQTTRASLPNLHAEMRAAAHRLAVLTGRPPEALVDELLATAPRQAPSDIVPVGLRSEILRRRPDVRRAERILAAATADIGVATAELFPRFFLTGMAGLESLSFGDLFRSGSGFWSLGPSIRWPIFSGGRIRANITATEARAEQAALRYEQAVLQALEDAESALVRYGEELETRRRLMEAVETRRNVVAIAKRRYGEGLDDLLIVLDAERELTRGEDQLIQSETRTLTYLISLYKALGGGWEAFEPEGTARLR